MKKVRFLFAILLCLMGCTAAHVKSTESTPGFALKNYQNFGFYEISAKGDSTDHSFNYKVALLKDAIRQQLTAKGLSYSPMQPDLLVNIGVVTREKVQTRETDFRTDAPRYVGQRRYSWRTQTVEVARYKEGTVSIDLVDREKNAMVWKGVVTAIIPRKEARLQKTIDAGISKLFSPL